MIDSFTVTIGVRDECDPRLYDQGILPERPPAKSGDECSSEQAQGEDEVVQEEAEVQIEEASESELIETVELITDKSCPTEIPTWFESVVDELAIDRGGNRLYYPMGEPVNVCNERMSVDVDFGLLEDVAFYDNATNSINFDQAKLESQRNGYYHVKIRASYLSADRGTVTFTKTIYI